MDCFQHDSRFLEHRRFRPLPLYISEPDPLDGRCLPSACYPHVSKPPSSTRSASCRPRLRDQLKSEIEIMALQEKLDRIRVEHLEGVLREQSGQLRMLIEHASRH